MSKVAVLGECMIEISQRSDGHFNVGYGGDTLNTAIYLCRCGGNADYFTVLGDDPYSQMMLDEWSTYGVGIDNVKVKKGTLPGLYAINTDNSGERSFHYWRQNSPVRSMLSDFPNALDQITEFDYLFLSGITLSLFPSDDLVVLFDLIAKFRKQGGVVVFDNNYRPRNWMSLNDAQETFKAMMKLTDVALISFEDEQALNRGISIDECMQNWINAGATEVVIKNGHHGCHSYKAEKYLFHQLTKIMQPIDTTAAGDSFNGAYLAEKLKGKDVNECVIAGQQCASTVIMHKGAIIDKDIRLGGL